MHHERKKPQSISKTRQRNPRQGQNPSAATRRSTVRTLPKNSNGWTQRVPKRRLVRKNQTDASMKNTPLQNGLSQRACVRVGSTPLILWGQKRSSRNARFWKFVSHIFGEFWTGRNSSKNSPFTRNENGGSISHIQRPKPPSRLRAAYGGKVATPSRLGTSKTARNTTPPLPLAGLSLGSPAITSMRNILPR